MDALLEVPFEREAQEAPPGGQQLHAGAQAALNERELRVCKMLEEVVNVRKHLESGVFGQRRPIYSSSRRDNHLKLRNLALHQRKCIGSVAQQGRATGSATDGR